MSDDLESLDNWIAPLIDKLDATQRRALAKEVARDLARSQRDRIKTQENPDGTPFEPRKNLEDRSGRIRRKAMFTKIRTAKYLKAKGTADAATASFVGRVSYVARVHQEGLRARVEPGGPRYDYPERRLLGYTAADRDRIQNSLIDHLTPR